ncbi:DUF4241 domain-containing protein [Streptomyces sp. A1547]|nr:DUF4241 domain-containing protein [Streptomyces sp. A1547]
MAVPGRADGGVRCALPPDGGRALRRRCRPHLAPARGHAGRLPGGRGVGGRGGPLVGPPGFRRLAGAPGRGRAPGPGRREAGVRGVRLAPGALPAARVHRLRPGLPARHPHRRRPGGGPGDGARPGDDTLRLRAGAAFGFGTDGATGAFGDAAVWQDLRDLLERANWQGSPEADKLADSAVGMHLDGGGLGADLAVFCTGSDGVHPVWVGRSASGEVDCVDVQTAFELDLDA